MKLSKKIRNEIMGCLAPSSSLGIARKQGGAGGAGGAVVVGGGGDR